MIEKMTHIDGINDEMIANNPQLGRRLGLRNFLYFCNHENTHHLR